jgi:hypothetical protein
MLLGWLISRAGQWGGRSEISQGSPPCVGEGIGVLLANCAQLSLRVLIRNRSCLEKVGLQLQGV